jgi:hypothetical protein
LRQASRPPVPAGCGAQDRESHRGNGHRWRARLSSTSSRIPSS